jgi:hypothetical protein
MDFREFFAPYLGACGEPGENGFAPVHCPLHDDRHISAGIHVRTGVFNCFVCGALSPANLLARVSGMDGRECHGLVDAFRREAGLVEVETNFAKPSAPLASSPQWASLALRATESLSPALPVVQDYMEAKGLSYGTLERAGLGYLPADQTHWRRDSIVFPYFYDGKVVGLRYRDAHSNKGGEPGCHFTLWGVDALDQAPKVAVVVEGETDRLTVLQATRFRYTVVSTPTANFRMEWKRLFDGVRQVIVIPQDDDASQKRFAQAAKAAIPGAYILQLPWKRKQWGKDVNDWVRCNGEEALADILDNAASKAANWIYTGQEVLEWDTTSQPWLINNLLGRQQVAIIAGHPKSMKTFLALTIVRCVLMPGSAWCGISGLECGLREPARVLFIEEEGDRQEFRGRIIRTLNDTPWLTNTWYGHHLGFRIDEDVWVDQILEFVKQHDIDLLVIDPFQRTFSIDENESAEMGLVWHRVQRLLKESRQLSIVLLHHFNKMGAITDGWNALRGSSRIAAEVDLGIFVAKRKLEDGPGIEMVIDGRAIPPVTDAQGRRTLHLEWDERRGTFMMTQGQPSKGQGQMTSVRIRPSA